MNKWEVDLPCSRIHSGYLSLPLVDATDKLNRIISTHLEMCCNYGETNLRFSSSLNLLLKVNFNSLRQNCIIRGVGTLKMKYLI